MDEELGGRRRKRGRENRDSYCRERSTETESKCEREDEKQKKEVGKVCHAFSGEGTAPWRRGLQSDRLNDQKMKKPPLALHTQSN